MKIKDQINYKQYKIQRVMQQWQQFLIAFIGWIYFSAWSVSFYGQIFLNYQLKSVQGMNLDFVVMNITGFLFYSIFTTYGYHFENQQTGKVDLNDLMFAYHALCATIITIIQALFYQKGENKVHKATIIIVSVLWMIVILLIVTTNITESIQVIGYFKILISLFKYVPQAYWNYQRKSTKGWSIFNVVMDCTGGIFSLCQMFLQVWFMKNTLINPIKIGLGLTSLIFDTIFLVQHYYLYRIKLAEKDASYQQIHVLES